MNKLLVLSLLGLSLNVFSQKNEEERVMDVIDQVFEAMKTSDSTLLKKSFIENPNTFTAFINAEGESILRTGNFQKFVNAVGKQKDQVWSEPIWNEKVQIDDNLASVWVDYAFYIDDEFSHCGVDAFHLIKQEDGWKIFHLVDTRRGSNCEIPDDIKK